MTCVSVGDMFLNGHAQAATLWARPAQDRVITVLSLLVLSIPTFVMANLLILAALRVNSILGAQVFEYTGETSADVSGGWWNHFVDRVQHLVLPTLTLGAAGDGRLQPLSAQRDARRAGPGFHPHRPRQGPDAPARVVQARAAHRADTDGDAVRLRHQRTGHRRSVHREDLRLARHGRVVRAEHRDAGHEHRRGRHPSWRGHDPCGRPALRRHSTPCSTRGCASHDRSCGRPTGRRHCAIRVSAHPGAAPLPAQRARSGGAHPAGGVVRRLLCAAAVPALQLHRFGLLRTAGAPVSRAPVRHQLAGPRSAGPDAARHAEVHVDRCLRGVHLGDHRSHGGIDRRILRRLARQRADVHRRPCCSWCRRSS